MHLTVPLRGATLEWTGSLATTINNKELHLFAIRQQLYLRQMRRRSVSRGRRGRAGHCGQRGERGILETIARPNGQCSGPVHAARHAQTEASNADPATHLYSDPVLAVRMLRYEHCLSNHLI